MAFPGPIATGRGFLVAWVDEDGDGLLKLDADGVGELAVVPTRAFSQTLVLDDIIVDGTRWKASRFTLDPNDTSSPSGSELSEDELTGWTVRF